MDETHLPSVMLIDHRGGRHGYVRSHSLALSFPPPFYLATLCRKKACPFLKFGHANVHPGKHVADANNAFTPEVGELGVLVCVTTILSHGVGASTSTNKSWRGVTSLANRNANKTAWLRCFAKIEGW